MKVLFLDIDGVLNSSWSEKQPGGRDVVTEDRILDPKAMEILRPIFYDPDVCTVISSDWKWHYILEGFQRMFPDFRVIDTTKKTIDQYGNPIYGNRWEEIETYLKEHSEITVWAAVDDIPLLHSNAVRTHDHYGIRPKHVKQIAKILDINLEGKD